MAKITIQFDEQLNDAQGDSLSVRIAVTGDEGSHDLLPFTVANKFAEMYKANLAADMKSVITQLCDEFELGDEINLKHAVVEIEDKPKEINLSHIIQRLVEEALFIDGELDLSFWPVSYFETGKQFYRVRYKGALTNNVWEFVKHNGATLYFNSKEDAACFVFEAERQCELLKAGGKS